MIDPITYPIYPQIINSIAITLKASPISSATKIQLMQMVRGLLDLQNQAPLALNDPELLVVKNAFVAAGFTIEQVNAVLTFGT